MKSVGSVVLAAVLWSAPLHADVSAVLSDHAVPFEAIADFSPMLDEITDQRLVLMGESTHGTAEFYLWRAEISKQLIAEQGFNFIAVEGDWPALARINAYVKHKPGAPDSIDAAMAAIDRWPHWMWRNREFKQLVAWLRDFNREREPQARVGLYGVDLYAKQAAMRDVIDWSTTVDDVDTDSIERMYACLARFAHARDYVMNIRDSGDNCAAQVEYVLGRVRGYGRVAGVTGDWTYFNAEQNAKLVVNAERHLRANLEPGPASWNHRAGHFELTTKRLLDRYGDNSRGIVWAHNTHIGDARATDMAQRGMVNIGQLSRERWGREKVYSIGFGTYEGNVYAARQWEGARETMPIPPARPDSWEHSLHAAGLEQFYLLFSHDELQQALDGALPHRAIGVTYNPEQESGNYVNTILPERYDAFIYIRRTDVLAALD